MERKVAMQQWILVVDDDAGFRDCVAEIFREEGFSTTLANGGRAALEILKDSAESNPPCLILLDARMPDVNGAEFLRALRQILPLLAEEVPLLLCSASPNSIPEKLLGRRAAFLRKPADVDEIVFSARTLIEKGNSSLLHPAS
jgi:CheY-like chemotaxis protein